ncbi:MAG: RecB family exonuclease [Thermodesulfobacteriota bacterium]
MGLYSYTRLATYKQCPYKYKLRYIDKIPEVKTIEQFMGSTVHKTLEKLYKDVISAKLIPLERILEYYQKRWARYWHDNIKFVKKDLTKYDYRALGEKCIEDYYKSYYPFNQSRTIHVEKGVSFALDNEGRHKIRGFIDRLAIAPDGTYEIHDYKTSGTLPTQKDKDEDKQLALYQIGVQDMWRDVHSIKHIWHYLVFNKEIASSRTDRDIEKLIAEKIALIKEIEAAAEFPPIESVLCHWCSYQSICPLWKHLFVIESLPEKEVLQEKGIQLVDRLERLQSERREVETQIEETKEDLFEYSDREGVDRIFGSTKVARVKTEEKITFPESNDERRSELDKVIRESGKWNEVSSLNLIKLAKKFEEGVWDEEVLKNIERFGDIEEKKSVTLVKKKGREE